MRSSYGDYVFRSYATRKVKNISMLALVLLAGVIALVPLLSIFGYVVAKGIPAINWSFFTEIPKPVGEIGGGMANALFGTLMLVGLACLMGIPWGIIIGLYLSEMGRGKRGTLVRFSVDMLASVPSIVVGLFVYALMVIPMKRFSALAGGVALAILMIPTVARVTEEILKLVPVAVREAGLALGLPKWRVTLSIVVKGSLGAVLTGVILAVARVAGETAPLLFTALGNLFWNVKLDQPMASVPVQIYNYAISPYEDWHRMAWAGALVLIVLVFTLNLATRVFMSARRGAA